MIIALIIIFLNFIIFLNIRNSNTKIVFPIILFLQIYIFISYFLFKGDITNNNFIILAISTAIFYIMTAIILITTYVFLKNISQYVEEEIKKTIKFDYYKEIPFRIELIKDFLKNIVENNSINYLWVNSSNQVIIPTHKFSSILVNLSNLINLKAKIHEKRKFVIQRDFNTYEKTRREITNTNIKSHGENIFLDLEKLFKHYKDISENNGDLKEGKIITYEVRTGLYRFDSIKEYMNLKILKEKLEKKITKYVLYNEDNILILYNGKKLRIITSIYNRAKHIKIYYAIKYIMKHDEKIKNLKCEIIALKQGKVKHISVKKILKEGEKFLYGEPKIIKLEGNIENPFENMEKLLKI